MLLHYDGELFSNYVGYALEAHGKKERKKSKIPYIGRLVETQKLFVFLLCCILIGQFIPCIHEWTNTVWLTRNCVLTVVDQLYCLIIGIQSITHTHTHTRTHTTAM